MRPRIGSLRRTAKDPLATEADVAACYRLLLQREPDTEGLRHHVQLHAGATPVRELVRMFLESDEFQQSDLCKAVFRYDEEPTLIQFDGFRLWAWRDDTDIGHAIVAGSYEPHVTRAIARTVERGMTVIDIGANVGYFSMLMASLVGETGTVIAIEASRANIDLLDLSVRENGFGNVTAHHRAVWSEPTELRLLRQRGSNAAISNGESVTGRTEHVAAVRLDDLVSSDTMVNAIKIDIEGAEHRAALGATNTIERCRPVVFSEFSPEALRNVSGVTGEDYLRWFTERDYSLALLDGRGRDFGRDINAVMALFAAGDRNHVDLRLTPG